MPWTTVPIDGGLDLITAPQSVQAGRIIACSNYEVARQRGLSRMGGYEKFDGGRSPSVFFNLIQIQGSSGDFTTGQRYALTATDGSGGTVGPNYLMSCVDAVAGPSFIGYFVYLGTDIGGNILPFPPMSYFNGAGFQGGITAFPIVTSYDFCQLSPAIGTEQTTADYITALANYSAIIKPTIQQVPGQGNVNGIFWLKDKVYATRDYLSALFTTGTTQPQIGDVMYQGASFGAATWTGQLQKVVLSSGAWSDAVTGGNAAGTMMFYNVTGTMGNVALSNNTHAAASIATVTKSGPLVPAQSSWAISGDGPAQEHHTDAKLAMVRPRLDDSIQQRRL